MFELKYYDTNSKFVFESFIFFAEHRVSVHEIWNQTSVLDFLHQNKETSSSENVIQHS